MAFKKYPQPPFKKFVKTKNGYILETGTRMIEPATFSKKGRPLLRFGWTISWSGKIMGCDLKESVLLCDLVVATADTKEELE